METKYEFRSVKEKIKMKYGVLKFEENADIDADVIVPERDFGFIKWGLFNFITERYKILWKSEIYS